MEPLRILLFAGLVLHKLVWEIYKRRAPQTAAHLAARSLKTWIVKGAKTIVLVFLLVQTLFWNVFPITDAPAFLQIVGAVIFFAGLALAVAGRMQLGDNWANIEDAQILNKQTLVHQGVYGYIRHPIYVGDSLLLIGLELALNSWLVVLMIAPVVVFLRRAAAEEKLLARSFTDYTTYRQQTKRFIPFLY